MIKFLGKLLVSIVSVAVMFLLIEVVFSLTHAFGARKSWSQPDTQIGYRYTPGKSFWYNLENDHPITGRINAYGWRDRDWPVIAPDHQYRVALLGDSFVEAFQVEDDSTFLNLVEQRFNRDGRHRIEMMNFGRSDFTQSEELIVLKHDILQFRPDRVMLFFLPGNDIRDVLPELALDKNRPFWHVGEAGDLHVDTSFALSDQFKFKKRINFLKQHSAFISFATGRYNASRLRRSRESLTERTRIAVDTARNISYRIGNFLNLATSNPDSHYLAAYRLNKRLIKEIHAICSSHDIAFTLVLVACENLIFDNVKNYLPVAPDLDPFWFERDLQAFSRAEKIPFLSLQTVFNRKISEEGATLFWGHWNYAGHRLAADIVGDYLLTVMPAEEGER